MLFVTGGLRNRIDGNNKPHRVLIAIRRDVECILGPHSGNALWYDSLECRWTVLREKCWANCAA